MPTPTSVFRRESNPGPQLPTASVYHSAASAVSSRVAGGEKGGPLSSEGEVFWVVVQVIFVVNGKCCSRQIMKPSLDVWSLKTASEAADL